MTLPVNIKVKGKLCIIIGGGSVAKRKVLKLLDYGAFVKVIAPVFKGWNDVIQNKNLKIVTSVFNKEELNGAFLVIAATDDYKINKEVVDASRELGIMVQRVDSHEESDFIFPATLKRGDFTVSFSTNGSIPALATKLKEDAESSFGQSYEDFCELAKRIRIESKKYLPRKLREEIMKELLHSNILNLLSHGESIRAYEKGMEILESFKNRLLSDGVKTDDGVQANPIISKNGAEKKGKVFLVGAGPGDPGLITVKGRDCLQMADTVLYDCMANPLLMDMYCNNAEKINVTKQKGHCEHTQAEIIEILISKANEGKIVVRLKGGDPMIFGRGGEEARALQKAGVYYEIVPGVSSVASVPAYSGIPITDREYSSSFGVYTVHRKEGLSISDDKWNAIAKGPDTLVFLMGKTRCNALVEKLIQFGRPPHTPIALIYNGTTDKQQRIVGTLDNIIDKTINLDIPGPGLIVVGEVVCAIPEMDWFHSQYSNGKSKYQLPDAEDIFLSSLPVKLKYESV